jgi:glycosyltransferase involved in cell wall biosynthesis
MRAAIYSPYLDTLGGGERYVLSVARALAESGWDVFVETEDKNVLKKAEKRFGFSLKKVEAVNSINRGDGYDLCFWLSDGSIPALLARKNILHFQRPFSGVEGRSLLNRMKFFRINKVVVNSYFTKKFIDAEYPQKSLVLYPPVDVKKFRPQKKEKIILYVGRFSQLEQAKRQDILICAFKTFYDKIAPNWQLVLAGGSEIGRTGFIAELKTSARGYPVRIWENPAFKEIRDLFAKSQVFWSAAGFGVNAQKHPEKLEHFGITPVEAMAAGCIPIIFAGGGHQEIIREGQNGFLWKYPEELIQKTADLVQDNQRLSLLAKNARKEAKKYSYERFKKEFLEII